MEAEVIFKSDATSGRLKLRMSVKDGKQEKSITLNGVPLPEHDYGKFGFFFGMNSGGVTVGFTPESQPSPQSL